MKIYDTPIKPWLTHDDNHFACFQSHAKVVYCCEHTLCHFAWRNFIFSSIFVLVKRIFLFLWPAYVRAGNERGMWGASSSDRHYCWGYRIVISYGLLRSAHSAFVLFHVPATAQAELWPGIGTLAHVTFRAEYPSHSPKKFGAAEKNPWSECPFEKQWYSTSIRDEPAEQQLQEEIINKKKSSTSLSEHCAIKNSLTTNSHI